MESIAGVNWSNSKQKIGQQKAKAPEVPEREKDLFWSEEENQDETDRSMKDSSIDITVRKTPHESHVSEASESLEESYVKEVSKEEVSYQKSENVDITNVLEAAAVQHEENSEEGDLTMLTNAVKKMKERKYKRKSILHDLDNINPMGETSQSEIKSLKVFVPHHR